jgi:hypothetical protein
MQQIWILRDNAPVAIAVTRGISDGKMTEVSAGIAGGDAGHY